MQSLLAQTVSDWELIVCDSFSHDGSWEYLQSFGRHPRVRLFRMPRQGAYAAWNACLAQARAEYIYIATADDTCEPTLLENMIEALARAGRKSSARDATNQEASLDTPTPAASPRRVDIAVCDYRVIDAEGKTLELDLNRHPRRFYGSWMQRPHLRDGRTEFLIHACLGIVWVTMTAILFRRRLLEHTGLFPTDRGAAADQEWQMRACLASDIAYVPDTLATWRLHGPSQESARARTEYYDTNVLRALKCVLDDPASGIPESWKQVPGWRKRLLAVQRSLYWDGFDLYGNVARREPKRFLRNIGRAFREQPGLLLRQARRGFRWSPEFSVDGYRTLLELMDLFGCPWPPVPC